MDNLKDVMDIFDSFDEQKNADYSERTLESLLCEIDGNIGGDEFKALAHEIALVAPQIKKSGTEKLFFSRCYLFSVNDGCGLETYLNQMASLVNKVGLSSSCGRFALTKLKKVNGRNDNLEDFADTLRQKAEEDNVCVDICDYISDVRTPAFRNVLLEISELCSSCIVVFRIPFVDKEVLSNVYRALNDVLFVREVSFPPYTTAQIDALAAKHLSDFGFKVAEDAWKGFNTRIREESSDGRFYGNDTVLKVVRELLYSKLLANASKKRVNKLITATDTQRLCKTVYIDDRSGEELLNSMVGVDAIKQRIYEIVSEIELARSTGRMTPCLHMQFVGNPGTGKTTIARIIGKIFKEKGILRVGEFIEHNGRDFCGQYIGETAPKTLSMCREAYGSVLFIDEAYSLYRGADSRDFGKEALDTLVAEMENHRSDMVVIMAGYTDDMEKMLRGNVGLRDRLPYKIEFANFTREQLYDIFASMCERQIKCDSEMLNDVRQYFLNLDKSFVESKAFSNARYVRNLYERTCAKAAMRAQLAGEKNVVLQREDFARAAADSEFANTTPKTRKIGFGN